MSSTLEATKLFAAYCTICKVEEEISSWVEVQLNRMADEVFGTRHMV